jgi:hypothetical protein
MPEKRIVQISLDDDVIMATDEDGTDLLWLAITIKDRKTRMPHRMYLQFPLDNEYEEFRNAMFEVFCDIAAVMPNIEFPNSIDELTQEGVYKMWAKVTSHVFVMTKPRTKMIDLVFRYMHPYVEEIGDFDKSMLWLRGNMCIRTAMKMCTAALVPDEWIKKNGTWGLQRIFQLAIPSQSGPTLPARPDFPSLGLGITQLLRPASGLDV